MKIVSVVGARPNFMKVAPVHEALGRAGMQTVLVHTGQHYDANMSSVFFDELKMPRPDVMLEVGSGSHAVQTARILERFEPVVLEHRPDWVLVAGDVNSTIACALVATKLGVRVAHLEAGLRSHDRAMPEEINRVLTDSISDALLTPSADADENLMREGVARDKIFLVGNAMIDSLLKHRERANRGDALERFGLKKRSYGMVTLHRPSNVDDPDTLAKLITTLGRIAEKLPLLFPIHPRTRSRLGTTPPNIRLTEPLGYLEFLQLQDNAQIVLTDSGGIQEETTALGVPCLTLRENTERPITITEGTNTLVGTDPEKIVRAAFEVIASGGKVGRVPKLWDGKTGERVAEVFARR
jgi:UDP-N-acetylglucosamine 2-epimerase (non-hydrolysing)